MATSPLSSSAQYANKMGPKDTARIKQYNS